MKRTDYIRLEYLLAFSLNSIIEKGTQIIQLYMTPRNDPSIKAKSWLIHQGLEFQEINLLRNPACLRKALLEIMPLLEGNALEIIATKSKNYRTLNENMSEMTLLQLIDYLVLRPRLLKQPIIYEGNKIQIGFNPDEIRMFIPRQIRQIEFKLMEERINSGNINFGGAY